MTEEEFRRERIEVEPIPRTREELAYYRLFKEALPGIDAKETVGLFATA